MKDNTEKEMYIKVLNSEPELKLQRSQKSCILVLEDKVKKAMVL